MIFCGLKIMPRIRIRKNYDLTQQDILSNPEYESDDEKMFDEGNYTKQPKGWYATTNIISCLPDNKIQAAIAYHHEQIKILEQELVFRRNNSHRHYSSPKFNLNENVRENKHIRGEKRFRKFLAETKLSKAVQDMLVQVFVSASKT